MPTTHHHVTCPLDCPGACALVVETNQKGQLERIRGNPEHPFTQGLICAKTAHYQAIQEGPRILKPMIRTGPKGSGQFRTCDWPEAMTLITKRLQQTVARYGAQAVWPFRYGGTMGVVQQQAIDRLTHRAGFSRQNDTICYTIGFSGWQAGVGAAIGPNPLEMAQSDHIILWGINAVATHINLMPLINKARKQGATFTVVDPYRNETARKADHHLAPKPGTDGALAVAMMHVLLDEGLADRDYLARMSDFDPTIEAHIQSRSPQWAAAITGLKAEEIRRFARAYGQAKAPFIRAGLGMSRQGNGAVNLHAISCLPTLTGSWQVTGGGALFATGDAFPISKEPVRQTQWMDHGDLTRALDMSRIGAILTDSELAPPVKSLIVFNANPAVTAPDSGRVLAGLKRKDLFTVVHEQIMTDTAKLADIILPASTFLEHEDLYKSYGQYTLQHAVPTLAPRGAARSNHDLVNDLARRLGYDDAPFQWSSAKMVAEVLKASQLPPREQWGEMPWIDCAPDWKKAHFQEGFPQPDGRFHFRPNWSNSQMPSLPDHWPVNRRDRQDEAQRYPLDFMTPPAKHTLNGTFTESQNHRHRQGPPHIKMHPSDAEVRHIQQGDQVRVFNDLGGLTFTAQLTDEVPPGLCLSEGLYRHDDFPEGVGINRLSHAQPVAPNGGPALHDNRIQISLVKGGSEK
ncbi:MAG: molybdopterin-dependent oxidoreductase [Magnetococcales bacterium]|nr:molybdopterin-dependent oxidoreductase [Magnetococcales bacterium]